MIEEDFDVGYHGLVNSVSVRVLIGKKIEKDRYYHFKIINKHLVISGNEILRRIRRLSYSNKRLEIKGPIKSNGRTIKWD